MVATRASEAAAAYVEAINRRDVEGLLALFAPDARLVHPFGVYAGHAELREFYGDIVIPAETTLTVDRALSDGPCAVIEVSAVSPVAPEQTQYAVDLFEVDDAGKVTELRIYYRNFDLG